MKYNGEEKLMISQLFLFRKNVITLETAHTTPGFKNLYRLNPAIYRFFSHAYLYPVLSDASRS
jgi:hypothetical protein